MSESQPQQCACVLGLTGSWRGGVDGSWRSSLKLGAGPVDVDRSAAERRRSLGAASVVAAQDRGRAAEACPLGLSSSSGRLVDERAIRVIEVVALVRVVIGCSLLLGLFRTRSSGHDA